MVRVGWIAAVPLAAVPMLAIMATLAAGQTAGRPLKVGVYHTPSLLVAYAHSPQFNQRMAPLMAQFEAAKKANDQAKVAELSRQGEARQERLHRQMAGEERIDDVLEVLQPAFPEVARAAQVDLIAGDVVYAGANVEKVDITDRLIEFFHPTEQVWKIVRSLPRDKPFLRVH